MLGPPPERWRTEPLVIIESPYYHALSEIRLRNRVYLKSAVLDSIERGEAPFASHGFYTQFLSDLIPAHRALGLRLMRRFILKADYVAAYTDLGISRGMAVGIEFAKRQGLEVFERKIGVPHVEGSLHLDDQSRSSRRKRR